MLKNHHKILAAVLVAQIILSAVVFWPRPSTAGQRAPLFPDLTAEDVTALTIEGAESEPIELKKAAESWVLPNADEFPAREEAVLDILEKLTSLTTGRLVTSNDVSHKRLQVAADDFARRIVFETGDGAKETVYIGSSPQYGSVHFRVGGQSEAYLTSELTIWDVKADVSGWIDTSYQNAAQADVTKMTLENANGTFVFEKEDGATWAMLEPSPTGEGQTLKQVEVNNVLRQAASQTMKMPLGTEERETHGMDEPSAVVTLETPDKTVTVQVGAKDADDESYVIKSSESDYYVRVAARSIASLVENGREAFLQEPTPQPESSGS